MEKQHYSRFVECCNHYFSFSKNKTSLRTELLAGLTTFSTMAYIIAINPSILSQTGMDFSAVMVATIGATLIGTLYMGLFANYPFAVAPGMGLNAYFTYGIVLSKGYSWQEALGACFIAGWIFFFLNITGIRALIMNNIPTNIRIATTAGIGLLLSFIALQNLGIIVSSETTLIGMGTLDTPQVIFAGIQVLLMSLLLSYQIPGAILFSMLFTWVLGLSFGYAEWKGFFSLPPSILPTLFRFNLQNALDPAFIPIVFSLVFVGLFDATGTLLTLAEQGNFFDRHGRFPRIRKAIFGDTLGTLGGSLLGTSPTTTFLESSSGIAVGGKTGFTAIVVAFLFFLSLFFTPFVTSIPVFATAPVLLVIGALMLQHLRYLAWDDFSELIPAFLVVVTIPFTYSIAWGMALGFVTYPLLKVGMKKSQEVSWIVWILALLVVCKIAFF